MTKNHDRNGLLVLGGPETHLHDILWAIHDGKNRGRSEGRKISGGSRLWWEVGGRACALLSYTYARVCEVLALTEPERGVGL